MKLIGRHQEQFELRRLYQSDESEFAIVYGRRRVGKTYLVRETLGKEFCFYATGIARGNKADQLASFHTALIEYGLPEDSGIPTTWLEAFDLVKTVVERSDRKRKVIFLDEMPWMDTPKSKFLPALDLFWNKWASARNDILLIGCGSAASWMVQHILEDRGGLHNRITCKIKLQPFTLKETRLFLVAKQIHWSYRDMAEAYMAMGGIPYYLRLLDRHFSLAQNMDRLFFNESSLLEGEFNNLYASLFRNAKEHVKIIEALSRRKAGLKREEILRITAQTDGGTFGIRLDELEQCGFIRKYKAVGVQAPLYQLTDFYTLFYMKFLKDRRTGDGQQWMYHMQSRIYSTWTGLAFERLCLSQVSALKAALGIEGVATTQYSLQTPEAQIDLLIDRADRFVSLCEMKYFDGPYGLGKTDAESLERKVRLVKEKFRGRSVMIVYVSPEGLKENAYSTSLVNNVVTLKDLFR